MRADDSTQQLSLCSGHSRYSINGSFHYYDIVPGPGVGWVNLSTSPHVFIEHLLCAWCLPGTGETERDNKKVSPLPLWNFHCSRENRQANKYMYNVMSVIRRKEGEITMATVTPNQPPLRPPGTLAAAVGGSGATWQRLIPNATSPPSFSDSSIFQSLG